MSLINKEIKPFKATAYPGGKFVEFTEASMRGKWATFLGTSGDGCNYEWREP